MLLVKLEKHEAEADIQNNTTACTCHNIRSNYKRGRETEEDE